MTNTYTLTAPKQILPLVKHLSYRLLPILLKTSITPNQITSASLLLGLSCAFCFTWGNWLAGIMGGVLLVASYTLDNCDGAIARIKHMSSEFGAQLDDASDWIVDTSFFVALGYGTMQSNDKLFWLWLGLAAAAGASIDYVVDRVYEIKRRKDPQAISREEQAKIQKQPADRLDWLIYIFHKLSRADFCMIVLSLAMFNLTWILLPFAAIGAQLYWITDLFERARGYRV